MSRCLQNIDLVVLIMSVFCCVCCVYGRCCVCGLIAYFSLSSDTRSISLGRSGTGGRRGQCLLSHIERYKFEYLDRLFFG